ncbi:ribbon-helix-helix domain-containing protein [Serratia fonticola]|uniref:ribbon-helix-helix domain-containing protein n=1 Tax=Serratia fonticola TaxID=47917 RepID=UPI00301BF8C9
MAIHKKSNFSADKQAAADAFLHGAPDVKTAETAEEVITEKGIPKGNKRQISITIDGALLRKLDAKAAEMGTGRSAFISMAVFKAISE